MFTKAAASPSRTGLPSIFGTHLGRPQVLIGSRVIEETTDLRYALPRVSPEIVASEAKLNGRADAQKRNVCVSVETVVKSRTRRAGYESSGLHTSAGARMPKQGAR